MTTVLPELRGVPSGLVLDPAEDSDPDDPAAIQAIDPSTISPVLLTSSPLMQSLLSTAIHFVGTPYRFGGAGSIERLRLQRLRLLRVRAAGRVGAPDGGRSSRRGPASSTRTCAQATCSSSAPPEAARHTSASRSVPIASCTRRTRVVKSG